MRTLWPAAVAVAVLGSWIDFAALPGLNWPLWTLAAAFGLALCGRASAGAAAGRALTPGAALTAVLACVLSTGAAVTTVPPLQGLTFLGVAALAAYAVQSQIGSANGTARALILTPLSIGVRSLREAAARLAEAAVALRAGRAVPALRGLALALPILIVLYLLLSGADPTLAAWRDALTEWLRRLTFLPRTLFFGVLLTLMTGAYGLAMRGAGAASPGMPQRAASRPLGPLERLIVLGSVAALFGLFFVLQLANLFGDIAARSGSGVTFAESVHRGFGELTVAAALCLVLIVALDARAPRGVREPWIRAAGLIVIAEALLLLVSAYERVLAYETAYGYTVQRLFVQVYEGVIGVVLVLLAYEVWRGVDRARLLRSSALSAVVALTALIWLNPLATVVRANLIRYQSSGRIDAAYLAELAVRPDAIPELVRGLPQLAPADATRVRAALAQAVAHHGGYFGGHAWYEWNLRRAQARAALQEAGLVRPAP